MAAEFPYRLEYRQIAGKPVAYSVYIPTDAAGRASEEEEAMMKEIERLTRPNASIPALIAQAVKDRSIIVALAFLLRDLAGKGNIPQEEAQKLAYAFLDALDAQADGLHKLVEAFGG